MIKLNETILAHQFLKSIILPDTSEQFCKTDDLYLRSYGTVFRQQKIQRKKNITKKYNKNARLFSRFHVQSFKNQEEEKGRGNRSVQVSSPSRSQCSSSNLRRLLSSIFPPSTNSPPSPSSYFQAAVALEWDAIVPSRPLNSPTWKTHSSVKRSELVHVAAAATS